jgi:catechol 2,3-dioxygenase-like lactoylglutathione lyase family enzyme
MPSMKIAKTNGIQMRSELDHVAVPAQDIAASVRWYVETFGAVVLYQDDTWAFLRLGQGKLALVTPSQHPPHVALRVDEDALTQAARTAGRPIARHRDGTQGIYIDDPDGNQIELICYPPGQTVYERRND